MDALDDLGALHHLYPPVVIYSQRIGVEKPDKYIFEQACHQAQVKLRHALHVGDELEKYVRRTRRSTDITLTSSLNDSDYRGAESAGMKAVLLRRPADIDNSAAHVDTDGEDLQGVTVVRSLSEVVDWVEAYNTR